MTDPEIILQAPEVARYIAAASVSYPQATCPTAPAVLSSALP